MLCVPALEPFEVAALEPLDAATLGEIGCRNGTDWVAALEALDAAELEPLSVSSAAATQSVPPRGTSPIRKHPPPWDHRRTLRTMSQEGAVSYERSRVGKSVKRARSWSR